MEKDVFFSIIMPVYNAEKYIQNAISSILVQSYEQFELLLIDDGSVDKSYVCCQEMAKTDKRIRVFRMPENHGASAARNMGLEHAKGRYVVFIDADDTVDTDFLEKAYYLLQGDVAISCLKCGVYEEYIDNEGKIGYQRECRMEDGVYTGSSIAEKIVEMEEIPLFGYVWNGIYLRELIETYMIRFDENLKVNEDFKFNIDFISGAKVLQCSSYCGYHYRKRSGASLSAIESHYDYDSQMLKIRSLLALWKNLQEIPMKTQGKISWMYTRFAYALLVRAVGRKEWAVTEARIRSDSLYQKWKEIPLAVTFGMKRRVMIYLLRQNFGGALKGVVYIIYFVKRYFPFAFAAVKK